MRFGFDGRRDRRYRLHDFSDLRLWFHDLESKLLSEDVSDHSVCVAEVLRHILQTSFPLHVVRELHLLLFNLFEALYHQKSLVVQNILLAAYLGKEIVAILLDVFVEYLEHFFLGWVHVFSVLKEVR